MEQFYNHLNFSLHAGLLVILREKYLQVIWKIVCTLYLFKHLVIEYILLTENNP